MKKYLSVCCFLFVLLANTASWFLAVERHDICLYEDDKKEIKEDKLKLKESITDHQKHLSAINFTGDSYNLSPAYLLPTHYPEKEIQPPDHRC